MKKTYIHPSTEVIKVETCKMLAASDPKVGSTYSGTETLLSREGDFDYWDE